MSGGSRAQEADADADAGGDVRARRPARNPPRIARLPGTTPTGISGGGAAERDGFGGRGRRGGADGGTRETTARDMMTIDPRRGRWCADGRARATGSASRSSRPTEGLDPGALLSVTRQQQGADLPSKVRRRGPLLLGARQRNVTTIRERVI